MRFSTDKLPVVFGRYLLLRRMSRGGMGEIFLAKLGEVEGFEKPIVIKTILPDLARDEAFLSLFIEEAKVAIKLNHGNIVPVYEVGLIDGQYFLAMEYVAGQDLRALLGRARQLNQRVPPDVGLYLVRELANGLAYAHRRTDEAGRALELVHCDISPPNVLVSYEGEVKIIDFGVAKSAMQRARESEDIGFGKFGYMAPEQLIRGAEIDRRADVYSTGVLLYELLTGQRLFNFPPDVDYRAVAREVTAARFPRPSERNLQLGEQFDNLVLRALHTDPARRYQSAEELRDAVQQQLYRMNPTISADTLAAQVSALFGSEIDLDRRMLHKISQTDLQPYQQALSNATSHTVTFALAAGAITRPAAFRTGPPGPPPASLADGGIRPPSAQERQAMAPMPQAAPPVAADAAGDARAGTRRLSPSQRLAAAVDLSGVDLSGVDLSGVDLSGVDRSAVDLSAPRTTDRVVGSSRRVLALAGGGLLLAGAIVLLVVFWPQPEIAGSLTDGRGSPDARRTARPSGAELHDGAVARTRPLAADDAGPAIDAAGVATADRADSGIDEDADAGVHLAFAPERVQRSKARHRARRSRPRRRGAAARARSGRGRGATTSSVPSAATVQRKFMQVRREYRQFVRAYGDRFEREWQRILFANTYGKKDERKYRELDRLLDELTGKMKQVRRGG